MKKEQLPSLGHSTVVFLGILSAICVGLLLFKISMHVLLIVCILWVCCNCAVLKVSFPLMKDAMSLGIQKGLPAIYIFFLIGVVIAAYIESGTIGSVVYYSLDFIKPAIFLPAGLVLCSLMSITTGTSWGTVGTVGVILVGIGSVLGIPLPIVAGMVISGASFGDKMSPISDTTNLAAACAETDLYLHIKAMAYTTIPAYILCLVIFSVIGTQYASGVLPLSEINEFKEGLKSVFVITPWAFLPLLVLLVLSLNKIAAEPAMIASAVTAVALAVFLQDRQVMEVTRSLNDGFTINTEQEKVDVLLNRGGVQSMMWTLSLTLIALSLGGLLSRFGFLAVLLRGILARVKRSATLVLTTISSCLLGNMTMGDAYLTIIMGSQLFKEKYQEQSLEKFMLSRSVEEGATLTAALVPWSTTGAFYFAALGVSPFSYAPYSFLNYLNPLISIAFAYMGIALFIKKGT